MRETQLALSSDVENFYIIISLFANNSDLPIALIMHSRNCFIIITSAINAQTNLLGKCIHN